MSETNTDSRALDWGVLHRIATDEGEVRHLRLRVRDVPEGKGRKEVKMALERAGRAFGEGAVPWGNHFVLPRDTWLDLDNEPAESLTYADLLDEARGEKRVTVRLPIGLHAQLVKASGGKSFNQFVTDTLADAIGYADESIEPSLPALAARRELSVDALRVDLAQRSAKASGSPFADRMGAHFAKIAGLPPEQLKAQLEAFYASPEGQATRDAHERIKSGADIFAGMAEEDLTKLAHDRGLTVAELRERFQEATAKANQVDFDTVLQKLTESSPEEVKANTLMLRDIFTGRAAKIGPVDAEQIETPTEAV